MEVTRASLDEAQRRGLLDVHQGAALRDFLVERDSRRADGRDAPAFRPAHILYYLGGMIAIGAMSLFMNLGWERFRGGGLFVIAIGYGLVALALTESLLKRRHLSLPAGITATLAVVVVPLAVYGLQHMLGLWPLDTPDRGYRDYHTQIDWRWLFMELSTLAAGACALWRYRLPFLVMPIAVTLWYMSMDLVPFLLGSDPRQFFSDQGKVISTCFGAAMTFLAFWVDVRSRRTRDFAFWLYVFGVLAFWGGLTSMQSRDEFGKVVYCCIDLLLIAIGAAITRRVFAVFGAIGVALYLGHLSRTLFRDSMMFPVALTAIGLGVIAAGIQWQRHEAAIGRMLRAFLPRAVRELVEHRSGH